MIAVVGLGSNLGDRAGVVGAAADRLRSEASAGGFRSSHLYETHPFGVAEQPDFINAVCLFETSLEATRMLAILKGIERRLGRTESGRWGPRRIDLDLLDLGGETVESEALTLPHPGIAERAFVLVPLCEVAPDWRDPLTGRSAAEMLALLDPDPDEVQLAGSIALKEEKRVAGGARSHLSDD
jgi:2-amino-4-hydroxy-6-hydroxymethyldihydropteridine diphosphokinase